MVALAEEIGALAREAGIDVVRTTHAQPFHGYLLADSPRRDPHLSLAEARSILLFGVYIGGFVLPAWDDPTVGRTSRLILSGFDLDLVKPLEPVVSLLENRGFSAVACDMAQPGGSILPLKLAAVRAGIGWQGKNGLLISRQYGSFMALGGIVTDAPLEPDAGRAEDRCGKCHACQDACPVGALAEPYRLDRERCLSHRLQTPGLPEEARRAMGNRVLQCEICQEVCPWNREHVRRPLDTSRTRQFRSRADELADLFGLFGLFQWSEQQCQEAFLPFRTDVPYSIFRRNVVVALGRSGHRDAIPLLRRALEDEDREIREVARVSLECGV